MRKNEVLTVFFRLTVVAYCGCGNVTAAADDAGAGDVAAELGAHEAGGDQLPVDQVLVDAGGDQLRVLPWNCGPDGMPLVNLGNGAIVTVCHSSTMCRAATCLTPAFQLPGLLVNPQQPVSVAGYDYAQVFGCGTDTIASCPPLPNGGQYTAICVESCPP
jgi:hypothetical protein